MKKTLVLKRVGLDDFYFTQLSDDISFHVSRPSEFKGWKWGIMYEDVSRDSEYKNYQSKEIAVEAFMLKNPEFGDAYEFAESGTEQVFSKFNF